MNDIKGHYFVGGKLEIWNYLLLGSFPEEEVEKSGLRFFRFHVSGVELEGKESLPQIENARITVFEAEEIGEKVAVRIGYVIDGKETTLSFTCTIESTMLYRYEGKSYKNLYVGNVKSEQEMAYYTEDKLLEVEQEEFGEGITYESRCYGEKKNENNDYDKTYLVVNRYYKDGKQFFEHFSDHSHTTRFNELIHHSNGHRYMPYHNDLYGISFYDLETDEHYDYVPEGMRHDYRWPCGESFIITDLHYDSDSDLLACGGCYWAYPSGVFVMDFREPLHYDPRMINIRDVVMGDNDEDDEYMDDWDFVRWEKDGLVVKTLGEKNEHFISKEKIREELMKLREKYPLDE